MYPIKNKTIYFIKMKEKRVNRMREKYSRGCSMKPIPQNMKHYLCYKLSKVKLPYIRAKPVCEHMNPKIMRVIPMGEKYLLWITLYQEGYSTFLINWRDYLNYISLSKKGKQCDVSIYQSNICCNPELSSGYYGTLLYGTFLKQNGIQFFCYQDTLIYKGYIHHSFDYHDGDFKPLTNYMRNDVICCSVKRWLVKNKYDIAHIKKEILNSAMFQDLSLYSIEYVDSKGNVFQDVDIIRKHFKKNQREKEMRIVAREDADLYDVWDEDEYCGLAWINTCNMSYKMNAIFRNIPENSNLDLIEESDDEDEKEGNINVREKKMICKWNHQVKQWVPKVSSL
jgi:hypothetical protein